MRSILIAHRDETFADGVAGELRAWGYHVIPCPGPLPPKLRCIRCDKGYCPLSEAVDLMIYDPGLIALDDTGEVHNLAIDSAVAHPDIPMVLAWRPTAENPPDAALLAQIHAAVPWVHVAASAPEVFRQQIHDLVAVAGTAIP